MASSAGLEHKVRSQYPGKTVSDSFHIPVGLEHKVRSQYPGKTVSDSFHIPVKNSFQVLKNLTENLLETQENAPTGLDDVVTALVVPTVKQTQTRQLYKASNTENDFSVDKNANTASKCANKGAHDNFSKTPLNTNAKVGVMHRNKLQTDTQQLATLGDGGFQFQPTPESGQAYDSVLPDPTSCTYVREEKIPLYVWNQKDNCKDYKACLSQNNDIFGYVPLTDLKYTYWPPS